MMEPQSILYPLLAMFILVNLVLMRLGTLRLSGVKNKAVSLKFYKVFQGEKEPDSLIATSRNLANLFEMPLLFYLILVLIYLTEQVDKTFLILAWSYVGLRYMHTLIHTTFNHIQLRAVVYALSNFVLVALWIVFFLNLS